MNVSLFDLAQEVRRLVSVVDESTGEIIETYGESRALFEQKALACVAYAKEEAATLESAKALVKDMLAKIETREKRLERFKDYMADCMNATGTLEVKHDLGIFGAKLLIDRDESVELDEGATFPPELCNAPKPPTPSKTAIKAAIKAGQPIAGARIVRKDRLTIT